MPHPVPNPGKPIGVAVFEYAWREDHARAGDAALVEAEGVAEATVTTGSTALTVAGIASTYAAIAQAHYAAANVRARPTGPTELRTKTPYVIPGVEGQWEIRGMATENFGATGNVELRLYRVGE